MATCYDCIHCDACSGAGDSGFSCLKEDVTKCKHFKNKADFVELSKVKDVIMQYIAEQTVSKYPTAELCKASRMGAEGVIYALEYAFENEEPKNDKE